MPEALQTCCSPPSAWRHIPQHGLRNDSSCGTWSKEDLYDSPREGTVWRDLEETGIKHATCQRKKIGERCVRKRLPNTEKKLPKGCREQVTRRDMAKVRHWPFCTKGKHFQLGWGEQQTLTTTAVRPWKSRKCNEQKTPKGRGSENELDSYKGYWQQEFTSDFEKLSD